MSEGTDEPPGERHAVTDTETEPEPVEGVDAPPDPDADGVSPSSEPTDLDLSELVGPERRLEPAVRYVWLLQAAVSAVVFGTVTGIPAAVAFDQPLVGPAVFAVVFVLGSVMAALRYRTWRYRVREDSLYLERGVLTHTKTVVPYVRIQHVDASRGPLERAFGLATAVVYTAGSRGADVSIPGLTPERADELQERLKRLAIAAEGEDAV